MVSAPVETFVPETALLPDQPPDAAHDVALVALHDSAEEPLNATEAGLALNVNVGAAGGGVGELATVTVTVALSLPPAPTQVTE